MRNLGCLIVFLLFSVFSFGGMTKESVQEFFKEVDFKSAYVVHIEKFIGYADTQQSYKYDVISLDPKTLVISCMSSFLKIRDKTGLLLYIPYNEIKILEYHPETRERYTEIIICID